MNPPEVEWNRTFGGPREDSGRQVKETSDGGYILIGTTYSFGAGKNDMWLIKTDSNGMMLWNKTFGTDQEEWGESVDQTSDNGFIIAGPTKDPGSHIMLIKTDSNGTMLWNKTFSGTELNNVQQISDGSYILLGARSDDVLLLKTDSDGNLIWKKTFGGGIDETLTSL